MRPQALRQWVSLSLRRDRRSAVFSAFGVAVGVGALVFFVSLGLGVGQVVREKVFPVDVQLLEVVPPTVSLGNLLGGGALDVAAVEQLARLEGVERAYRKMNVRMPAVSRYTGDFFGAPLRMGVEVLAVGVDPELVKADVLIGGFEDPQGAAPIPVVVASRLLEVYNKSFAPARKLPRLSSQLIAGFTFPVEFNRSFVAATAPGPVISSQLQVVGVSDRGLLAGVTVPLETARRLNRAAGMDAERYSAVTLRVRHPDDVPRVSRAVREMGFQIDDQERRMGESAGAAVALVTSALALLSALICVLAATNIAHALSASVRARAKEIGVMQAVGASKGDIRQWVFTEAAVLGLGGGAAGTLGAWALSRVVDGLAATYLPPFPFQPDSFFAFPGALLGGGVLLGLLAALLGAWVPAQLAASQNPARTLSG